MTFDHVSEIFLLPNHYTILFSLFSIEMRLKSLKGEINTLALINNLRFFDNVRSYLSLNICLISQILVSIAFELFKTSLNVVIL